MAGPRLSERLSAAQHSRTRAPGAGRLSSQLQLQPQPQTDDDMFKSDVMRNPFPRAKKPSSATATGTDDSSVSIKAKTPSLGGQLLRRPSNRSSRLQRISPLESGSVTASRGTDGTSTLVTLTHFHSRNANQSSNSNRSQRNNEDSSSSLRERNNNELESGSHASLPGLTSASSELPRIVPSSTTSSTSSIVATSSSSMPQPPRIDGSSGRTPPRTNSARKRHPRGLVGLQNLGNTCFMNSCLQCVSNVPALVKYFHPGSHVGEINQISPTKGALAHAFGDLLKVLWSGDKFSATRPVELKRVIGKVASRFTGYDQQDAQEFLLFLLDGLHEDLNRVKKKPPYYEIKDRADAHDRDVSDEYWKFYLERNASAISELFCGQLRSEIRCSTCSHRSLCFDVFWDLSLPVPKKNGRGSAASHMRITNSFFSGGSKATASADGNSSSNASSGGVSIHDCLKWYTELEHMKDDTSYYCSRCKTHRAASKKISVYRLPNVLVLHLKRFSFSTFSRDKVSTAIGFPAQSLDLAEYCAKDAVLDGSTLYDLTGIVHHMGSLNGGHYTAECLNSDTQEWFDFNDANVSAIKKPQLTSSSAYLLFYQRREEKSISL